MNKHAMSMITAALASVLAAAPVLAKDKDNNPPGPAGGPGTNWENKPGPKGGPGASKDKAYKTTYPTIETRTIVISGTPTYFVPRTGGYYYNTRYGYYHPTYGYWNQGSKCWNDRDGNPPGPAGGPGTNWENPPGWKGGPGASPDKFGRCR